MKLVWGVRQYPVSWVVGNAAARVIKKRKTFPGSSIGRLRRSVKAKVGGSSPPRGAMHIKKAERSHYDRHGKVKETYQTLSAAQAQADYLNRWKPRQWHTPSEGYDCWVCGLYHVGGRRYGEHISRRQVLMGELGERVYRELVFENRRSEKYRYRRILARYFKGHPELLKQLYNTEPKLHERQRTEESESTSR